MKAAKAIPTIVMVNPFFTHRREAKNTTAPKRYMGISTEMESSMMQF